MKHQRAQSSGGLSAIAELLVNYHSRIGSVASVRLCVCLMYICSNFRMLWHIDFIIGLTARNREYVYIVCVALFVTAVFDKLWWRSEVKDGDVRGKEASRGRLWAVSQSRSAAACSRRAMSRQALFTVSLDNHRLVTGLSSNTLHVKTSSCREFVQFT